MKEPLELWPDLLKALAKNLESSTIEHVDGALGTLAKICEDNPKALENEKNRPLDSLIPKFLTFFFHKNESFRLQALSSVNHFLFSMPKALEKNMENYLKVPPPFLLALLFRVL
jgi:transportin-1